VKDGNCLGTTTPFCDNSRNTCVACLAATDCTSATAAACTNGSCTACTSNADCSHLGSKGICNVGTCVQCTVANETPCNGNSCNPATYGCTSTPVGMAGKCKACLADSECIGGVPGDGGAVTSRCVPMSYKGTPRGGYCLQRGTAGCSNPYQVPVNSGSMSGATAEAYCGINQNATTCEAVLDLVASKICTADLDCGLGQGGLCKTVGLSTNHCSIPCISGAECLTFPAPGSTCNTNVTPSYCQ
jgi:hypothetical protein